MALPDPAIDTRTYRDIVTEALTRVPVHTPEWNNLGAGDPGVTLLQVFAFIAESAIYRANRIPLRNRQKFLRTLGIGLRPAQPAIGIVSFSAPAPLDIDPGQELTAGSVPFVTTTGLKVLPLETRMYFKQRVSDAQRAAIMGQYNRLYASVRQPAQNLDFYQTQLLAAPIAGALATSLDLTTTIDNSLWIALLAPPRMDADSVRALLSDQPLTLGIAPALDADGKTLYAAGPPASTASPPLVYEAPDPTATTPTYRPLQILSSDDVLAAPGLVELQLPPLASFGTWTNLGPLQTGVGGYPPALDNSQDLLRLLTWIRIRVPATAADTSNSGSQTRAVLSWVGGNAARVIQRVHIEAERLPDGTGNPDQTANLAHGNVLADSVALTVNGERWTRVDDLADAAPEFASRAPRNAAGSAPQPTVGSNAFIIDVASGEITYNARPPRGAIIVCSYDYGGGLAGDVAIGALSRIVNPPAGLTVSNPVPTWGAADAETVAAAEVRIPQFVKHREVAASRDDFKKIVSRTPGVDVARTEILPLMNPDMPNQTAPGTVTVLVIPRTDPTQPEAPRPDAAFLQTVCTYLEPRRVLTTELHIRGPDYQRIGIGVGIQAVPGQAEGPLSDQVRTAVLNFLSPLSGGFDETGWPLNKTVEIAEIQAAASRVAGVAKITGIVLVDQNGNALPNGLAISGIQLPRVNPVRVAGGAPPTPIGETAPADPVPALPVPILPGDC